MASRYSADCPSPHSPTISTSLNLRSLRTTPRRAKDSSSTIGTGTVQPPAGFEPCVMASPTHLRNIPRSGARHPRLIASLNRPVDWVLLVNFIELGSGHCLKLDLDRQYGIT